jgi:hypothetical protein
MSETNKRILLLAVATGAALLTSTAALADPVDPVCFTSCHWTDVACLIEKMMNGCYNP